MYVCMYDFKCLVSNTSKLKASSATYSTTFDIGIINCLFAA